MRISLRTRSASTTEIPKEPRSCPGTATSSVEDQIVYADLEGSIDVSLDVLRRELEADRDSSSGLTDLLGELAKVRRRNQVGKACRRDSGLSGLKPSDSRDVSRDLGAWQAPRREVVHAVFPSARGRLPAVRTLIDFLVERYRRLHER